MSDRLVIAAGSVAGAGVVGSTIFLAVDSSRRQLWELVGVSTETSPSPTAALQLRQREVVATPLAPLYAANQGNPTPVLPPVQNWSSASVLTPGAVVAAPVMAAVPPPAALPQSQPTATPTP